MGAHEVARRSAPGSEPERAPPSAREGRLDERYRSLFLVGKGGMGTVEAALEAGPGDQSGFRRVVALKRLPKEAARDARRVEMFLREARLAAMLDHPNVVRAFDYGELEGELFLAMEYVEGQPLSRVLGELREAGARLPTGLAAFVLAEVCEGLHAAHELRDEGGSPLHLVHRDVSPQNVMLGYDGRVRLLDFGVAKIEAESVTKTGEVKGKTAYMSPEQAMGDPLDRRSDLYGVGALLFECLALRRMWGDGTDMEVIRKLALEEPPRLEEVAADAPEAMARLYARLVARDPKDRPADAREVAEALRAFVPEGEAARAELARLLEAHFAEQAAQQHERLRASLDDVAPSQARELRESVTPEPAPRSARAAEATAPAEDVAARRRPTVWLLVGLAAVGVGVARMFMADPTTTPAPPTPPATGIAETAAPTPAASTPMPTPTPNATPNATPTPTPTPTSNANANTTPNATPNATPTPTPTSNANTIPTPPTSPRVVARPSVSAAPSAAASTAPPRASASSKPLDVDPTPF